MNAIWYWISAVFQSLETARIASQLVHSGKHQEARKLFEN